MSTTKQFGFRLLVQSFMEHKIGEKHSSVKKVEMALDPSSNLNIDAYLKENGKAGLTKAGMEIVTAVLVQALVSNIHQAHEEQYIDSAKHLREIISALEDGFVAQAKLIKGSKFSDINQEQ